jgi:hypothetical protein
VRFGGEEDALSLTSQGVADIALALPRPGRIARCRVNVVDAEIEGATHHSNGRGFGVRLFNHALPTETEQAHLMAGAPEWPRGHGR